MTADIPTAWSDVTTSTTPDGPEETPAAAIDLMAALRASIEHAKARREVPITPNAGSVARCVASKHIPWPGATCNICGATGMREAS